MSPLTRLLLASAAIVFSSTLPAFSQQLAEEVIEEYFSEMAQNGLTIDPGTKTVSGKTVIWNDIVVTMPNGQGNLTWAFIRAQEIGGDKVSVTYPEEMAFKTTAKGDVPAMDFTIGLIGATHIISGTADQRRHDFTAEEVVYIANATAGQLDMRLSLVSPRGSQVHSGSDLRHYKGDFSSGEISLQYSMNDKGVNMSMLMNYQDFALNFDLDVIGKENFGELLTGQRGLTMNYSMGPGTAVTTIDQPDFKGTIDTASAGGDGGISIVDGIFKLAGNAKAASYTIKFSELPLPPFQAEIDLAATSIEMPLKQSDAALPANILFNLTGLKASDTLWGMLDPTGSLPRDKANLNIDVTANMKWLVNLMQAGRAAGLPAEVQNVSINDITLEVAGARLHGTGSAVIDNSKFPPEPIGTIDVRLKGGIGLLDKLIALGLVPSEQGQMVKMFSGMFAVPVGDGPDHLSSKIEMKAGGSILVNGNKIK